MVAALGEFTKHGQGRRRGLPLRRAEAACPVRGPRACQGPAPWTADQAGSAARGGPCGSAA
eukprot:12559172-Alexandrium_andersonii.AAC.1